MASADVIGGGNIEPRALEEEMRTAYLDYAMSVIVGRALPGRARRAQARAPPRPVRDERARPRPDALLLQVRADRRRGDGQVPPPRRLRDLRHARAHGAGVLDALPARRRPGQLRLDRRRPGRRDEVLRHGRHARSHHARARVRIDSLAPAPAPNSDTPWTSRSSIASAGRCARRSCFTPGSTRRCGCGRPRAMS